VDPAAVFFTCKVGRRRPVACDRNRLRRNVKELLEFPSRGGFQTGQIAGEFIWVEDIPHGGLKAREFGSKL
jgi:hypothetical protein